MPDFNSDIAAIQAAPSAKNTVPAVRQIGELRFTNPKVTLPSGADAADRFILASIPAGAVVIPSLCSVVCEDPGTTLTLDIGDDDDSAATAVADRYSDGLTLSAGGFVPFSGALGVAGLTPYTTGKACNLIATIATQSTLTTGQEIQFNLVYAIP